jgi:hypothetical protein
VVSSAAKAVIGLLHVLDENLMCSPIVLAFMSAVDVDSMTNLRRGRSLKLGDAWQWLARPIGYDDFPLQPHFPCWITELYYKCGLISRR